MRCSHFQDKSLSNNNIYLTNNHKKQPHKLEQLPYQPNPEYLSPKSEETACQDFPML